jgi:hypothetical protein
MRAHSRRLLVLALTTVSALFTAGVPAETSGFPIGPSAFTPSAVVESFEGPYDFSAGNILWLGEIVPGTVSPWTFSSGVILTHPIPNTGFLSTPPVEIVDKCCWGLGDNGEIRASQIPLGLLFLAFDARFTTADPYLELTLPSLMHRVGAYVDASDGGVTLTAYGPDGALVGTEFLAAVPVDDWAVNFLGLESEAPISKVRFSTSPTCACSRVGLPVLVVDGLAFEAVPEPATGWLVALGIGAVAATRARPTRPRRSAP